MTPISHLRSAIFGAGALITLAALAQTTPSWWTTRGVFEPNAAPDDYMAINQGQLKNLARAAFEEMQARLPGGAGPELAALIASWDSPGPNTDNYAVVSAGQLATLGALFYGRLDAIRLQWAPGWASIARPALDMQSAATADQIVNTGQAKHLFAGLEGDRHLHPADLQNASVNPSDFAFGLAWLQDGDEDGTPDLQQVAFYTGHTPWLVIVSGAGQAVAHDEVSAAPVVIRAAQGYASPLANHSVTFHLSGGSDTQGGLALSAQGPWQTQLTVTTSSTGEAAVWWQAPAEGNNGARTLTATAMLNGQPLEPLYIPMSIGGDGGGGGGGGDEPPRNTPAMIAGIKLEESFLEYYSNVYFDPGEGWYHNWSIPEEDDDAMGAVNPPDNKPYPVPDDWPEFEDYWDTHGQDPMHTDITSISQHHYYLYFEEPAQGFERRWHCQWRRIRLRSPAPLPAGFRKIYIALRVSTDYWTVETTGEGVFELVIPPGGTESNTLELIATPTSFPAAGAGSSWSSYSLLPMELAPEKLVSNGDFDEGDTGGIAAQETGAIADNRNHTLIAKRDSVDGRVSAGDVVTDDLHQGWFGLSPGVMPDDFFDGAAVTITKKNKTDPDTGKREPGQVRFFATWGTNQELMIQPDDPFIDDLLANNPAPRNLVGKVYGTNKTVPSGATFWIEGVTPGKITLEYRIQKGSTDIKHEQTFEVRTEWTKAQWLAVVRDEIYLDSFTSSSGAGKNGFNNTGIDMNQYVVANDFLPNRPYIYSVYEYYAKLHDKGDGQTATGGRDKFLWAGLAKLAGAPVYGGMSDAQNGRDGLAIASFGVINDGILKGIQDLLIDANIKIYNDLAYQFVAYRTGGIKSMEHLKKLGTIDTSNYNAWKAIDEAGPAEIANANQVLLRREQEIILADTYTDLLSLWDGWIADAFSWLTRNPIVGGPSFQSVIPNGNIAVFADRWGWITHPQQGMWLLWTSKDKYQRQSLANSPLRNNATNFAFFSRYSLAPLR